MKPRIVLFLVCALTFGIFGVGILQRNTRYSTTRVEAADFVRKVEIDGNLRALDSSQIGPMEIENVYNYKISMLVPEGSEVRQGTPILSFDSSEQAQKLLLRRAEVQSWAKQIEQKEIDILRMHQDQDLELVKAQSALKRARLKASAPTALVSGIETGRTTLELESAETGLEGLKEKNTTAADVARAELEGLQAELRSAEAAVHHIEKAIQQMTRKAPRDGVVIYISNWRGDKKKVGDSVWLHEKVLEIPDLSRMEAEGTVEEALAGRLELGQKVSLTLDAHPDHRFGGVIQKISRTVHEKSWRNPLRLVEILISLDETDPERMRPGMHFKGSVVVERRPHVLMLPINAIREKNGNPVALRKTLTGLEESVLKVGPRDGDHVVILDGLKEGDRIILRKGTK